MARSEIRHIVIALMSLNNYILTLSSIHWGIYSVPGWVRANLINIEPELTIIGPDRFLRRMVPVRYPLFRDYINLSSSVVGGFIIRQGPRTSYGIIIAKPMVKYESPQLPDMLSENYGQDVVYDDFIANFTGAKFDANEWIDLFANAGAKYFVLVTVRHSAGPQATY